MFKKIEKWLDAKADAARQEQYDSGFGYAATQILKYDDKPIDAEYDRTVFDRGVSDAVRTISALQNEAKKLDRIEAENKDLREIVRIMQNELGRLLVQFKEAQPSSDAQATEIKLPFDLDIIPEWANWVAQDSNGMWNAYIGEPITCDLVNQIWGAEEMIGDTEYLCTTEVVGDWKDTLYKVPKPLAKS